MISTDITALLRAHGIAPTRQRVEIAHVLFSRCDHFSAEKIMNEINAQQGESSKATIYNTLKLFTDKGLVRELIVDPTKVFYDSNTRPHHHFYNTQTGELTDLPLDSLKFDALPELPEGMEAESIDIIVRIRPQHAS